MRRRNCWKAKAGTFKCAPPGSLTVPKVRKLPKVEVIVPKVEVIVPKKLKTGIDFQHFSRHYLLLITYSSSGGLGYAVRLAKKRKKMPRPHTGSLTIENTHQLTIKACGSPGC